MNETKKIRKWDSVESHKCLWCGDLIKNDEPAVMIYGTGNSIQYLVVYHKRCDQLRLAGAAQPRWVETI
jgi:hypothetical protein